jgi:hypothetical protein
MHGAEEADAGCTANAADMTVAVDAAAAAALEDSMAVDVAAAFSWH